MRHATPQMRGFAEHLIGLETARKPASTGMAGALLVCERLRPHLATLMGTIGFQALLSRALGLAAAENPSLQVLHIDAEGSFSQLPEAGAPPGADRISDGGVVLVAQLLGLLVTFIGEDLTLRLVRQVWPKASLDDPGVAKGSKNADPK